MGAVFLRGGCAVDSDIDKKTTLVSGFVGLVWGIPTVGSSNSAGVGPSLWSAGRGARGLGEELGLLYAVRLWKVHHTDPVRDA